MSIFNFKISRNIQTNHMHSGKRWVVTQSNQYFSMVNPITFPVTHCWITSKFLGSISTWIHTLALSRKSIIAGATTTAKISIRYHCIDVKAFHQQSSVVNKVRVFSDNCWTNCGFECIFVTFFEEKTILNLCVLPWLLIATRAYKSTQHIGFDKPQLKFINNN